METCTWDDLCAWDGESGYHVFAEGGLFRPTKHEHVTTLSANEIADAVPHPTGRRKNGVPVYFRGG